MTEYFWRRLLSGDNGETSLAVVLLIGLFCVAIWQPQRIARPTQFRTASLLFALTLLFPAIAELVFRFAVLDIPNESPNRGERNPYGLPFLVSSIIALAGRILFALSVVCALGSLDVGRHAPTRPPVSNP